MVGGHCAYAGTVLLALAGSYHAAHALGEEIRLKTAPVDTARPFLRGLCHPAL